MDALFVPTRPSGEGRVIDENRFHLRPRARDLPRTIRRGEPHRRGAHPARYAAPIAQFSGLPIHYLILIYNFILADTLTPMDSVAVDLGPIQETLLIPLLGRAEETRRPLGLLEVRGRSW